jgi:hypothetical protein
MPCVQLIIKSGRTPNCFQNVVDKVTSHTVQNQKKKKTTFILRRKSKINKCLYFKILILYIRV